MAVNTLPEVKTLSETLKKYINKIIVDSKSGKTKNYSQRQLASDCLVSKTKINQIVNCTDGKGKTRIPTTHELILYCDSLSRIYKHKNDHKEIFKELLELQIAAMEALEKVNNQ